MLVSLGWRGSVSAAVPRFISLLDSSSCVNNMPIKENSLMNMTLGWYVRTAPSEAPTKAVPTTVPQAPSKGSIIQGKLQNLGNSVDRYVRTSGAKNNKVEEKKDDPKSSNKAVGLKTFGSSIDRYVRTSSSVATKPVKKVREKQDNSGDMPAPPWREAASIIVAARTSLKDVVGNDLGNLMGAAVRKNNTKCDYRLLMVKRSSLSSFMANAYVFPGGLVELADFSPRWYEAFETLGVTRESLEEEFVSSVVGPRPAMIKNPSTLAGADRKGTQFLPADIALRIAAIRETFEETGILLLTRPSHKGSDQLMNIKETVDLAAWRERIHEDPLNFIDLCLETGTCPNLWSLYEWWDWLTPTSVGHRRYDTMFYLCCLDRQPQVVLDQSEVITLKWCAPDDMLEEHQNNSVFLAPPQVYELSRMHHLRSYIQLQNFAAKRASEGVEQWLPVIATAQDGALSLLPGDDMYPAEPDYFGRQPGPDYPHTLSELESRVRHLHRMAVRGPICTAYCNITPGCGHLQPLTYRPAQPIVQSYL